MCKFILSGMNKIFRAHCLRMHFDWPTSNQGSDSCLQTKNLEEMEEISIDYVTVLFGEPLGSWYIPLEITVTWK